MRINGTPASQDLIKRNVGLVHQHVRSCLQLDDIHLLDCHRCRAQDYLFAELTCYETLDFIAKLSLPLSDTDRRTKVENILTSLGLRKV